MLFRSQEHFSKPNFISWTFTSTKKSQGKEAQPSEQHGGPVIFLAKPFYCFLLFLSCFLNDVSAGLEEGSLSVPLYVSGSRFDILLDPLIQTSSMYLQNYGSLHIVRQGLNWACSMKYKVHFIC